MVKMAESPFNWFVEMVGPARFELATSKTLRSCFQIVTTFSRRKKWPTSGPRVVLPAPDNAPRIRERIAPQTTT